MLILLCDFVFTKDSELRDDQRNATMVMITILQDGFYSAAPI